MQCILDCLPVSVSTELLYSDDQFASSYSNPYKLYINALSTNKFLYLQPEIDLLPVDLHVMFQFYLPNTEILLRVIIV